MAADAGPISTQEHHDRKIQARPALRALAHRLSAYRRAPARRCSTGFTPAMPAAPSCLRIEDTDRARSTPEAIAAILNGPGMAGPRLGRADRLPVRPRRPASRGRPNSCWPTARPIAATRPPKSSTRCASRQRAAGKPIRYDGRWRDREPGPDEDGKPYRRASQGARRTARPSCTIWCRATCASPTTSSTT